MDMKVISEEEERSSSSSSLDGVKGKHLSDAAIGSALDKVLPETVASRTGPTPPPGPRTSSAGSKRSRAVAEKPEESKGDGVEGEGDEPGPAEGKFKLPPLSHTVRQFQDFARDPPALQALDRLERHLGHLNTQISRFFQVEFAPTLPSLPAGGEAFGVKRSGSVASTTSSQWFGSDAGTRLQGEDDDLVFNFERGRDRAREILEAGGLLSALDGTAVGGLLTQEQLAARVEHEKNLFAAGGGSSPRSPRSHRDGDISRVKSGDTDQLSGFPRYTPSPGGNDPYPDRHAVVTPSSPHPTYDAIGKGSENGSQGSQGVHGRSKSRLSERTSGGDQSRPGTGKHPRPQSRLSEAASTDRLDSGGRARRPSIAGSDIAGLTGRMMRRMSSAAAATRIGRSDSAMSGFSASSRDQGGFEYDQELGAETTLGATATGPLSDRVSKLVTDRLIRSSTFALDLIVALLMEVKYDTVHYGPGVHDADVPDPVVPASRRVACTGAAVPVESLGRAVSWPRRYEPRLGPLLGFLQSHDRYFEIGPMRTHEHCVWLRGCPDKGALSLVHPPPAVVPRWERLFTAVEERRVKERLMGVVESAEFVETLLKRAITVGVAEAAATTTTKGDGGGEEDDDRPAVVGKSTWVTARVSDLGRALAWDVRYAPAHGPLSSYLAKRRHLFRTGDLVDGHLHVWVRGTADQESSRAADVSSGERAHILSEPTVSQVLRLKTVLRKEFMERSSSATPGNAIPTASGAISGTGSVNGKNGAGGKNGSSGGGTSNYSVPLFVRLLRLRAHRLAGMSEAVSMRNSVLEDMGRWTGVDESRRRAVTPSFGSKRARTDDNNDNKIKINDGGDDDHAATGREGSPSETDPFADSTATPTASEERISLTVDTTAAGATLDVTGLERFRGRYEKLLLGGITAPLARARIKTMFKERKDANDGFENGSRSNNKHALDSRDGNAKQNQTGSAAALTATGDDYRSTWLERKAEPDTFRLTSTGDEAQVPQFDAHHVRWPALRDVRLWPGFAGKSPLRLPSQLNPAAIIRHVISVTGVKGVRGKGKRPVPRPLSALLCDSFYLLLLSALLPIPEWRRSAFAADVAELECRMGAAYGEVTVGGLYNVDSIHELLSVSLSITLHAAFPNSRAHLSLPETLGLVCGMVEGWVGGRVQWSRWNLPQWTSSFKHTFNRRLAAHAETDQYLTNRTGHANTDGGNDSGNNNDGGGNSDKNNDKNNDAQSSHRSGSASQNARIIASNAAQNARIIASNASDSGDNNNNNDGVDNNGSGSASERMRRAEFLASDEAARVLASAGGRSNNNRSSLSRGGLTSAASGSRASRFESDNAATTAGNINNNSNKNDGSMVGGAVTITASGVVSGDRSRHHHARSEQFDLGTRSRLVERYLESRVAMDPGSPAATPRPPHYVTRTAVEYQVGGGVAPSKQLVKKGRRPPPPTVPPTTNRHISSIRRGTRQTIESLTKRHEETVQAIGLREYSNRLVRKFLEDQEREAMFGAAGSKAASGSSGHHDHD